SVARAMMSYTTSWDTISAHLTVPSPGGQEAFSQQRKILQSPSASIPYASPNTVFTGDFTVQIVKFS
ncbi:hypothetical protein, partial [Pseudomonas sp. MWU13-2105]|uniref:hypothetical protein n=1 Tax=Pseudomonas sp. MWU13-2105 TaxID=2935074 RepID=UPI00201045E6